METTYCPNGNYIFEVSEKMISEWKLHIFPNGNYILSKIRQKSVEKICGKRSGYPQFPNQNYMYFHNVRMKATYLFTASE